MTHARPQPRAAVDIRMVLRACRSFPTTRSLRAFRSCRPVEGTTEKSWESELSSNNLVRNLTQLLEKVNVILQTRLALREYNFSYSATMYKSFSAGRSVACRCEHWFVPHSSAPRYCLALAPTLPCEDSLSVEPDHTTTPAGSSAAARSSRPPLYFALSRASIGGGSAQAHEHQRDISSPLYLPFSVQCRLRLIPYGSGARAWNARLRECRRRERGRADARAGLAERAT